MVRQLRTSWSSAASCVWDSSSNARQPRPSRPRCAPPSPISSSHAFSSSTQASTPSTSVRTCARSPWVACSTTWSRFDSSPPIQADLFPHCRGWESDPRSPKAPGVLRLRDGHSFGRLIELNGFRWRGSTAQSGRPPSALGTTVRWGSPASRVRVRERPRRRRVFGAPLDS